METIFAFLIKTSTGITLFYVVYWLFLRKETFYSANRWFLISALLTAVVLPLFPVQYSVFVEPQNSKTAMQTISDTFKNIPVVSESKFTVQSFNWQQVSLIIYITGASIFLMRLLGQTFILLHLMIKHRVKSLNGIRIVENEKYGLPFSFFNIVFINPKFHTQDELPEILAHEKVHIRENHWFDLLFIELLTVIFWFNPFIWFFERSIKQNHEYLADKGVLAQGHGVARYQALLVNQLMGMQIIGVTNNLNFALNTNRLKMMTKKKTSRLLGIKFVWALPAIAILLFAFAEPSYKQKVTASENYLPAIQKNEKEFHIKGKVIREDNKKPMTGASIVIKGTTIGTVADKNGEFKLVDTNPEIDEKTGALSTRIVVSFVGMKTVENVISASGEALNNGRFTIKMEDGVILINSNFDEPEIPPPPPPVQKTKIKNIPPPPPPLKKGEKEKEIFFIVEDMPAFPGGFRALSKYVQNLTEKYNLKGKAKIGFTVTAKGNVTKIKIIDKDSEDVGKAAAEIISKLPNWKPGSQRGKNVPVKFLIAVEFK